MYEKSWKTRGLVLLVALIGAMAMLLFDKLLFPQRFFLPFTENSNEVVPHLVVISLFISIWLSYVLAALPGVFFLKKEGVPHYIILSFFAATVAILSMFPLANVLYPFFGHFGALLWAEPIGLIVAYVVGFELLTGLARRTALGAGGGVILLLFLLNVLLYFQ